MSIVVGDYASMLTAGLSIDQEEAAGGCVGTGPSRPQFVRSVLNALAERQPVWLDDPAGKRSMEYPRCAYGGRIYGAYNMANSEMAYAGLNYFDGKKHHQGPLCTVAPTGDIQKLFGTGSGLYGVSKGEVVRSSDGVVDFVKETYPDGTARMQRVRDRSIADCGVHSVTIAAWTPVDWGGGALTINSGDPFDTRILLLAEYGNGGSSAASACRLMVNMPDMAGYERQWFCLIKPLATSANPDDRAIKHWHGVYWLPRREWVVAITGDHDSESTILFCDDVVDLVESFGDWDTNWGMQLTNTAGARQAWFATGDGADWTFDFSGTGYPPCGYAAKLTDFAVDGHEDYGVWQPDDITGEIPIFAVDLDTKVVETISPVLSGPGGHSCYDPYSRCWVVPTFSEVSGGELVPGCARDIHVRLVWREGDAWRWKEVKTLFRSASDLSQDRIEIGHLFMWNGNVWMNTGYDSDGVMTQAYSYCGRIAMTPKRGGQRNYIEHGRFAVGDDAEWSKSGCALSRDTEFKPSGYTASMKVVTEDDTSGVIAYKYDGATRTAARDEMKGHIITTSVLIWLPSSIPVADLSLRIYSDRGGADHVIGYFHPRLREEWEEMHISGWIISDAVELFIPRIAWAAQDPGITFWIADVRSVLGGMAPPLKLNADGTIG